MTIDMRGTKLDYLSLATASDDFLEEVLRAGQTPDPAKLAGWEFRGFNSMDLTTLLGFRKFKKGFYQDGGELRGYNVKVEQGGLLDPWVDQVKNGDSVKHGWYDVYPVRTEEVDNLYPNTLLLNYAAEKNPKVDPSRFLRDYLVQVDPENDDLYLGKAYVALGPKRVFVSYFVLERENPSSL
jgi:hypothetical protein